MEAHHWLEKADSKKILSAYLIKRLAENGGTMYVAHIQNELFDPRGVVADIITNMMCAGLIRIVSRDGQISLIRAADRLRMRKKGKR
ncbi:MAG: hypothetical protein AAB362_03265 [Patescibacteria group bacterium]